MAEKKKKNRKWLFISIAIIVLLLAFFFGAKIWLYFNFLLGNDVVVRLDAGKENLNLLHGQEENLTFKSSVIANPFCSVTCDSKFEDISANKTIEQSSFSLKTGFPIEKTFTIFSPGLGQGQKLYSYNIMCSTKKTLLCDTREEPTARTILVTVQYNLRQEEKSLKDTLKVELEGIKQRISIIDADYLSAANLTSELSNKSVIIGYNLDQIKDGINTSYDGLFTLKNVWDSQNYTLLKTDLDKLNLTVFELENSIIQINNSINADVSLYNELVDKLNVSADMLAKLSKGLQLSDAQTEEVNDTIPKFNDVVSFFTKQTTISRKKGLVNNIYDTIESLYLSYNEDIKQATLKKEIFLNIEYGSLCAINGMCMPHANIAELANQTDFSLNSVCNNIDALESTYHDLNDSMNIVLLNQSYPSTPDFQSNISAIISNIRQNITNNYLAELPSAQANTQIIKSLLIKKSLVSVENYSAYNITPALILELVKKEIVACNFTNTSLSLPNTINVQKIPEINITPVEINLEFDEPSHLCCVFGNCRACCITADCKNNESRYPIVFVHGHWFSKDVSAEYSLDAFNNLQAKLESDGYLDAGAISLYTSKDVPEGIWSLSNVPLSLKASYYFDTFQQPNDYVIVPSKSENIDTYAIRLKDIIDTIKYKTGSPKVILIAHSMGGLVSRRYIQIFGSGNVDKLILMAAPNKGIAGNVKDYCPIFGEKRECEDMNNDSVFLKKLNSGSMPNIPIFNIIGTGCDMSGSKGDGVVLENNAKLDGAANYIINGTCKTLDLLHIDILNTDKYPETYKIIKEILKTNSSLS